jgi:hypothetical protein
MSVHDCYSRLSSLLNLQQFPLIGEFGDIDRKTRQEMVDYGALAVSLGMHICVSRTPLIAGRKAPLTVIWPSKSELIEVAHPVWEAV